MKDEDINKLANSINTLLLTVDDIEPEIMLKRPLNEDFSWHRTWNNNVKTPLYEDSSLINTHLVYFFLQKIFNFNRSKTLKTATIFFSSFETRS